MTLLTDSRSELVTAFSGHGFKVYASAPAVPKPPCVVVIADQPWVRPGGLGANTYEVRWRVLIVVSPRNNDAAQNDAEGAVETFLAAIPAGYQLEQVGPPQITDTGAQGAVITTEIALSAYMKG